MKSKTEKIASECCKEAKEASPCCSSASSCCGDAKESPETAGDVKSFVRERYAEVAKRGSSCCGPASSCCGNTDLAQDISRKIGYAEADIESVPDGANLGLGCGNPIALSSLKEGETVLDLGSGAGFDCFLAARKVGDSGKVIGVDMTPEMLEKARRNAKEGNYRNVEFRLGEIENLPVGDNSVDVVISNCVINLVPDKEKVFAEIFRALKPSGRLMISDIVLLKELPDAVQKSMDAYASCISGAILRDEYIAGIKAAGFRNVKIVSEANFSFDCIVSDPTAEAIIKNLELKAEDIKEAADSVLSIAVSGFKPKN